MVNGEWGVVSGEKSQEPGKVKGEESQESSQER